MRRLFFVFVAFVAVGAPAAWAQTANLSITKTDGALTSTPGGTVTYTMMAFNSGPDPAPGSAFGDLFTAPLNNCSWTCVGQNSGACTTAMGSGANANQNVDLPVGGSVLVTATCSIDSSATLSFFNTATITVPMGFSDENGVNNSATDVNGLEPSADLSITKTDGTNTFQPGGSTIYTIVASNAGPSDALGATVADTFPAALTCDWTCIGSGGGTCTAMGAGDINDMVDLPAGASVTYSATCSIADQAPEPLVNVATVTAPDGVPDPTADNNTASDFDVTSVNGVPTLGDFGLAAAVAGLVLVAARRRRRWSP